MQRIPVQTYFLVLLLTLGVVSAALYGSFYINTQRTEEIKSDENKIAIDILTLETKIDLAKEAECRTIDISSLSRELSDISDRLNFMESQAGATDSTIFRLKRYQGLLEIKSYLINQKLQSRCGQKIPMLVWFYRQQPSCPDCDRQAIVLAGLRNLHPEVILYNLDFDNDRSAFQSYVPTITLPSAPPAMIIKGKLYTQFLSLEEIEKILNL